MKKTLKAVSVYLLLAAAAFRANSQTVVNVTNGGGSGASQVAQITDFLPARATVTTTNDSLTGNASCTATAPCNLSWNGVTTKITQGFTATLSGTSSSGTLTAYTDNGALKLANPTAATLTCNAGCTAVNGPVPTGVLTLWTWSFTANAFDSTGFSDLRAAFSLNSYGAGTGVTVVSNIISVDKTVTSTFTTGAGAPGNIAASKLGSGYLDTTNNNFYKCFAASGNCTAVAAGNWVQVNGGGGASQIDYQNQTAVISVPQDFADHTIFTTTVPGNTLGAGGCITIDAGFKTTTGAGSGVLYKLNWAGTTANLGNNAATTGNGAIKALVCNNPGVTNAQQINGGYVFTVSAGAAQAPFINTTPAADTTASQTVSLVANDSNVAGNQVQGLWWRVSK